MTVFSNTKIDPAVIMTFAEKGSHKLWESNPRYGTNLGERSVLL